MAVSLDASPSSAPHVRVSTSILASISALAALIIYAPVLIGIARQWIEDADAGYGVLVGVAAAFVFRQRIPRARLLPVRGSAWGVLPLVGACALYVTGTLAADLYLVRLSMPAFAAGALLFIGGAAHLRALAAPLALCVVAIPLPSALVTEVTMPLQLLASQCAAGILGLLGVPVVRDGNVLALSSITLQVAQACSGMRSLVSLLALVAVYAALREMPIRRVVLLAAATVPVALAGNGLRVAATALLALRMGAEATRGVTHEATGWVAFVLMCGALLAVQSRFRVGSESIQSRFRVRSESVQSRFRVRAEWGDGSTHVGRTNDDNAQLQHTT